MNMLWLCPIQSMEPFILGTGRVACLPNAEMEMFRERLRRIHPRLLMMFKANVLLEELAGSNSSANQTERCGLSKVPFSFAGDHPIRLERSSNQTGFILSTCATALLARMLPQADAQTMFHSMAPLVSSVEQSWLEVIQGWMDEGKHVILILEEQ